MVEELSAQMKMLRYNITLNEIFDVRILKNINIINVKYNFKNPFQK